MAIKNAEARELAGQYWSLVHASKSETRPLVLKSHLAQADVIVDALRANGWRIVGDGTGAPRVERLRVAGVATSRVKSTAQIEREIDAVVGVAGGGQGKVRASRDPRAPRVQRVQISAEEFARLRSRR